MNIAAPSLQMAVHVSDESTTVVELELVAYKRNFELFIRETYRNGRGQFEKLLAHWPRKCIQKWKLTYYIHNLFHLKIWAIF